jgi:hypothetical protein
LASVDFLQISDNVRDDVQQYTAPQLARIAGAYTQLNHKGYGYTMLLDAIVSQVLRSFKVRKKDPFPLSFQPFSPHFLKHL